MVARLRQDGDPRRWTRSPRLRPVLLRVRGVTGEPLCGARGDTGAPRSRSDRSVLDHPPVGYFGTFIYRDGEWREHGGSDRELVVDIHDSDIATVDYRPAPPGLGRFYLGVQPRDYFEDPDASRPVDVPAEVEAFRQWARQVLGTAPLHDDVRELVAEEGAEDAGTDFVEDAAARLIHLLGLPLPPALAEVTQ
jgi:hypothetical protein